MKTIFALALILILAPSPRAQERLTIEAAFPGIVVVRAEGLTSTATLLLGDGATTIPLPIAPDTEGAARVVFKRVPLAGGAFTARLANSEARATWEAPDILRTLGTEFEAAVVATVKELPQNQRAPFLAALRRTVARWKAEGIKQENDRRALEAPDLD